MKTLNYLQKYILHIECLLRDVCSSARTKGRLTEYDERMLALTGGAR